MGCEPPDGPGQRREALRRELSTLEGELRRGTPLGPAQRALRRELAVLDQRVARTAPVGLATQRARPCASTWLEMDGDERVRRCARCEQRVYDLSALDVDQARAVVLRHEGDRGAPLAARADGTLVVGDCGLRARRARTLRTAALLVASVGIALAAGRSSLSGARTGRTGPPDAAPQGAMPRPLAAPPKAGRSP